MNFKINYKFLDLTNTPAIERYLEEHASEGWFIHKILFGSLFIFKKTEPLIVDFSISPYEVEDAFTRKTESELQEFQEVTEQVGWKYVTESYDLHVYYKEKGTDAIPLETDEEETFRTLERLAKKQLRSHWMQLGLFALLGWFNLGGTIGTIDFLKEGAAQLLLPLLVIGLVIASWSIVHLRSFLKTNQENIEKGQAIEYKESDFLVPKLTFFLGSFFAILIILYYLYMGIFLKDIPILVFLIVVVTALVSAYGYRYYVKPAKISLAFKRIAWFVFVWLLFLIFGWSTLYSVLDTENRDVNLSDYQVLTSETFPDAGFTQEGSLYRSISFLVPESYDYYYISEDNEYVETEYARALTEGLAQTLVKQYKENPKRLYSNQYNAELEAYFEEGIYDDYLLKAGVKEEELSRLKELSTRQAKKAANELIDERAVSLADAALWNADEAYFLSYQKDSIVIRQGKEVFYLRDKDFTDPVVIKQARERLGLND